MREAQEAAEAEAAALAEQLAAQQQELERARE